ncbi:hypothetical protein C8Q74DRAFT_1366800 [Fomes fomentarius]|nr:hypothetical protein C8Q74DRAFT_1366800 [Fomes fomentarius]
MSFASRKTIAKIMETCRALNHEGVSHLMDFPITLRSEEEPASFVIAKGRRADVGYAEAHHRLCHLTDITFTFHNAHQTRELGLMLETLFLHVGPMADNFTKLLIYDAEDIATLSTLEE